MSYAIAVCAVVVTAATIVMTIYTVAVARRIIALTARLQRLIEERSDPLLAEARRTAESVRAVAEELKAVLGHAEKTVERLDPERLAKSAAANASGLYAGIVRAWQVLRNPKKRSEQ